MNPTPSLHLQGIGKLYAIPAAQIRPNDSLIWNYDTTEYTVTEVRRPSPQFLAIEETSSRFTGTRRLKIDRLVVVRSVERAYSNSYRAMRKDLKSQPRTETDYRELLDIYNDCITSPVIQADREALASAYGSRDAIRDLYRESLI